MKIGVVGNRKGWSEAFVYRKLNQQNITEDDVIVTGGANGVDQFGMLWAFQHGVDVIRKHPRRSLPIPERYFERNRRIVEEVDKLIAFDLASNNHSGTRYTIDKAKEKGIPIVLFNKHKLQNKTNRFEVMKMEDEEFDEKLRECMNKYCLSLIDSDNENIRIKDKKQIIE